LTGSSEKYSLEMKLHTELRGITKRIQEGKKGCCQGNPRSARLSGLSGYFSSYFSGFHSGLRSGLRSGYPSG
jgi:hypothetical protein